MTENEERLLRLLTMEKRLLESTLELIQRKVRNTRWVSPEVLEGDFGEMRDEEDEDEEEIGTDDEPPTNTEN